MILRLETLNEINEVLFDASRLLTQLVGEPVELRITKPEIEGLVKFKTVDDLLIKVDQEQKMALIVSIVCRHMKITRNALTGKDRQRILADARKIAAKLMFAHVPGIRTVQVGDALGKDHTSAIYMREQSEALLLTSKEFRHNYEQCKKAFVEATMEKEDAA